MEKLNVKVGDSVSITSSHAIPYITRVEHVTASGKIDVIGHGGVKTRFRAGGRPEGRGYDTRLEVTTDVHRAEIEYARLKADCNRLTDECVRLLRVRSFDAVTLQALRAALTGAVATIGGVT